MKQTFKTIAAATGLFISLSVNAQTTLYVPNGTSGIGTSINANNVGIGTNTPLAPLNVAGTNANPTSTIPANGALFVGSTATGLALTMGVFSNGGTNPLSWIQSRNQSTASTYYALSLNPLGGNISVGTFTLTPTSKLAVGGDMGWGVNAVSSSLSTDQGGSIELGARNSSVNPVSGGVPYIDFHYGNAQAQDFNMRIVNSADNRMDFAKSGNVPVMTISNNNVGIGTTSPADRLDVAGNIRMNDNTIYLRGGTDTNHGLAYRGVNPFAGQTIDGPVAFGWNGGALGTTNGGEKVALKWDQNGKVSIGLPDNLKMNEPGCKLFVAGGILTEKVIVSLYGTWADYVFTNDYRLTSLGEVENFIKENKHLPNIPSAKEVSANGINIGQIQKLQMEKIEELTLYLIEQNKRIEELENKLAKKNK